MTSYFYDTNPYTPSLHWIPTIFFARLTLHLVVMMVVPERVSQEAVRQAVIVYDDPIPLITAVKVDRHGRVEACGIIIEAAVVPLNIIHHLAALVLDTLSVMYVERFMHT